MIDCYKCEHFYVTWDTHFPHGCRSMKFKSRQLPPLVVLMSSQTDCLLFEEKTPYGGKNPIGLHERHGTLISETRIAVEGSGRCVQNQYDNPLYLWT